MIVSIANSTANFTWQKSKKGSEERINGDFGNYLNQYDSHVKGGSKTPDAKDVFTVVSDVDTKSMPVIDLLEYMKEHGGYGSGSPSEKSLEDKRKFKEEMAAQGIDVMIWEDMHIVDPLDPKYWGITYTDEKQIKLAQIGLLNSAKYFDFKNANCFDEMTANADYTGMSNAEKYTAIYDKYKYCYGENFLSAFAYSYPYTGPDDPYSAVQRTFLAELTSEFGSIEAAWQANKTAQYGNMSDSDIRKVIMDKYPPMGEITIRDFYKMTFEMRTVGVDCGIGGDMDLLVKCYDTSGDPLVQERNLDLPVTYEGLRKMQDAYNGKIYNGRQVHPELGKALGEIMAYYNVSGGSTQISKDTLSELMSNQAKSTGGVYVPREFLSKLY